jgi:hypothetical protein
MGKKKRPVSWDDASGVDSHAITASQNRAGAHARRTGLVVLGIAA